MNTCWLLKKPEPRIVVVYVYPTGGRYDASAARFAATYRANFPDIKHRFCVVCNGGQPTKTMAETFAGLDTLFLTHDNSGWDIGAFQAAARQIDCETMVFFGATAYINGKPWLERIRKSTEKHGLAIYGCMGNKGNLAVRVWPHLRTTGFWLEPRIMNMYPVRVMSPGQRYEFEHGETCLCEWIRLGGLKRWVVSFDGEYDYPQWDDVPNGYLRGDQSGLLSGDRMTEPPYFPPR